jgi:hypothetical protein
VLGVPAEGEQAEAVAEGHEAPAPVRVRHVQDLHPLLGQPGHVTLRAGPELAEPGRLHELDGRIDLAPRRQLVGATRAQIDVTEVGTDDPGRLDKRVRRGRILHVDRDRQVGAGQGEELIDGRHVPGELFVVEILDGPAPDGTDPSVVVEHRHAVPGEPDVGLEAGRAES